MHNPLSPSAYLLAGTPQTPSQADYTHSHFLLGSPSGHEAYLHHGIPSYSATPSAIPRIGYSYPSSGHAPLAVYPVPPPTYRPLQHKTQLGETGWSTLAATANATVTTTTTTTAQSSTMAITLPPSDRPAPSAMSGQSSRGDGSGSGSDGGRDPTPPSGRAKDAKKKVHPCFMCHKSFDRPSTLKKHLLVHTGEKAFACESCGRRFGVASNLNRHAKKCRFANPPSSTPNAAPDAGNLSCDTTPPPPRASTSISTSTSAAAAAAVSPASSSSPTDVNAIAQPRPNDASPPTASRTTSTLRRSPRKRKSTDVEETNPPPEGAGREREAVLVATPTAEVARPRSRKRARRAPSPAVWIPDSLKAFDLTPLAKGTPVPLPPVRPFRDTNSTYVEERDSFDENASTTPYHPQGWKGRLPGPGLLGHNVANRNGGEILVFNNC